MGKIVDIRQFITLTEDNTDLTDYDAFLEHCVVNSVPKEEVSVIFDLLGDDEIDLINKRWRQLVQKGVVDEWMVLRQEKRKQEQKEE